MREKLGEQLTSSTGACSVVGFDIVDTFEGPGTWFNVGEEGPFGGEYEAARYVCSDSSDIVFIDSCSVTSASVRSQKSDIVLPYDSRCLLSNAWTHRIARVVGTSSRALVRHVCARIHANRHSHACLQHLACNLSCLVRSLMPCTRIPSYSRMQEHSRGHGPVHCADYVHLLNSTNAQFRYLLISMNDATLHACRDIHVATDQYGTA